MKQAILTQVAEMVQREAHLHGSVVTEKHFERVVLLSTEAQAYWDSRSDSRKAILVREATKRLQEINDMGGRGSSSTKSGGGASAAPVSQQPAASADSTTTVHGTQVPTSVADKINTSIANLRAEGNDVVVRDVTNQTMETGLTGVKVVQEYTELRLRVNGVSRDIQYMHPKPAVAAAATTVLANKAAAQHARAVTAAKAPRATKTVTVEGTKVPKTVATKIQNYITNQRAQGNAVEIRDVTNQTMQVGLTGAKKTVKYTELRVRINGSSTDVQFNH